MPDTIPRSIAIRTYFSHHAENAGYKQILRFTRPVRVLGYDERDPASLGYWQRRYHFLVEWEAKAVARREPVDLLHILYGEEYLRFSPWLMAPVPVIATFHQPPDTLEREIRYGDVQGRVGRLTHLLSRKRFERLGAAIVMTQAQRDVLARVMPADKIHITPLGADLDALRQQFDTIHETPEPGLILTVGNWMRDWDFYEAFVKHCAIHRPQWRFWLINRRLPEDWKHRLTSLPSLTYMADAQDTDMYRAYRRASCHFLPFTGAAGNNSVNESLAMGCPVTTNIIGTAYPGADHIFTTFPTGDLDAALRACEAWIGQPADQRIETTRIALEAVANFGWEAVGNLTLNIYNSVL